MEADRNEHVAAAVETSRRAALPARSAATPRGVSLRWWLGGLFALIAAITAVGVVALVGVRTETAFRRSAQDVAAGKAFATAAAVARTTGERELRQVAAAEADGRDFAVFAFDERGTLLTSPVSNGVPLADVPAAEALPEVLDGSRVIRSTREGSATLVGVPLARGPAAALVTFTFEPSLRNELRIVREEAVVAAAWAGVLGALVGLVAAALITARLRALSEAAAAIEGGDLARPVPPGFGDEIGAVAMSIERMRERLRATIERIASDRDRLDRLLSRLTDGVVALGPDRRVEIANEAARALLGADGLRPGDPLPRAWDGTPLGDLVRRLHEPGAEPATIETAPEPDRLYLVTGVPAQSPEESALLVVTDLSERARTERAQRDFATNAAHELRTPVAAITNSVEMLQSGAKDDPEERDVFLGFIEHEADRLGRLARALLVLARAQAGEESPRPAPVRVRDVLERVAAGLRAAPDVRVEVACAAEVTALGDADLVEQAVSSLASNAAKYTRRGEIRLSGARADGRIVIEVADTGTGISRAAQDRVFERFFRDADGENDGFGLGLAIAQQAVAVLGGELALESRPGAGTAVRMTLPAAEEAAA